MVDAISNLGLALVPLEDGNISNNVVVWNFENDLLPVLHIVSKVNMIHAPMP
jgi:hypothetical protein